MDIFTVHFYLVQDKLCLCVNHSVHCVILQCLYDHIYLSAPPHTHSTVSYIVNILIYIHHYIFGTLNILPMEV